MTLSPGNLIRGLNDPWRNEKEPQAEESDRSTKTVLFVDDEPSILEMRRLVFETVCYSVLTATSGEGCAPQKPRRARHVEANQWFTCSCGLSTDTRPCRCLVCKNGVEHAPALCIITLTYRFRYTHSHANAARASECRFLQCKPEHVQGTFSSPLSYAFFRR
jgi:hypothetical protein